MKTSRTTNTYRLFLVVVALIVAACQAAPLDNPNGSKAGLAATPSGEYAKARSLINSVSTANMSSRTDYTRSSYGPAWTDVIAPSIPFARNGCDTRNDILRRDLTEVTVRAGTKNCIIETGKLAEPYTGATMNFTKAQANKIHIDHVVPLSYSWKMGAANWTDAKRRDFANDPLNLLAVSGTANLSKGDKGPGSWMPTNVNVRCSYSVRFAQAAKKYQLKVRPVDKTVMINSCK